MKNNLFESYIKSASRYITEDEEDLEDLPVEGDEDVDTEGEDLDGDAEDIEDGEGDEEALELDLSNPVCPSCGALLVPIDNPIDTEEEDEDGNPVYEDDEADAIELLQGLGYIVYKPTEEEIGADEDLEDGDEDLDDADADLDDADEDLDTEDEDF